MHREPKPAAPALERSRDLPVRLARHDHRVGRGDLVGEVGARVAQPDDQDGTIGELRGIAVRARMELPDPGIELGREGGHPRTLERAGGDDDLARLVATIAGGGNERAAVAIGGSSRSIRTPVSTASPKWPAYVSR